MGFRSTFTISDWGIDWPAWFVEKYKSHVFFNDDRRGTIAAKAERKDYYTFKTLTQDIQRAVSWDDLWNKRHHPPIMLVYLHECGGITRCRITRDEIQWTQPDGWEEIDGVEHHYCSHCDTVAAPGRARGVK